MLNNEDPDTEPEEEVEKPKRKAGKKREAPPATEEKKSKQAKTSPLSLPPAALKNRETGKYRFFLKFDQPSSFRLLTNILMNLVDEITFTIVRDDKFQGIQFNSFVGGPACYVSGSQSLAVQELAGDKLDFSVTMSDFGNSVKAIAHTAVTQIYQLLAEDHIIIEALDSMTQKVMQFRLPTIVVTGEAAKKLDDKRFDFTLEFPLGELDRVCKSAATLGSKNITFSLLKKNDQDMYVRLSTEGRVELSEYFRAVVGASGTIRASNSSTISAFDEEDSKAVSTPIKSDFSDYKVMMSSAFHIDNINKFVKPLEKNLITIFFALESQDSTQCICLCFQHVFANNLASENDRIRYIVAANVDAA